MHASSGDNSHTTPEKLGQKSLHGLDTEVDRSQSRVMAIPIFLTLFVNGRVCEHANMCRSQAYQQAYTWHVPTIGPASSPKEESWLPARVAAAATGRVSKRKEREQEEEYDESEDRTVGAAVAGVDIGVPAAVAAAAAAAAVPAAAAAAVPAAADDDDADTDGCGAAEEELDAITIARRLPPCPGLEADDA